MDSSLYSTIFNILFVFIFPSSVYFFRDGTLNSSFTSDENSFYALKLQFVLP